MGSLPPSSRVRRFIWGAAHSATCLPVSVAPVKAMRRMRGCLSSASPSVPPGPVTMFSTPLGSPAWFSSSMMRMAVRGVVEAGLTIMVFPAASAGPTLVPIRVMGKFQGTMPAQTPMGCLITIPYMRLSGRGTWAPRIFEASPA